MCGGGKHVFRKGGAWDMDYCKTLKWVLSKYEGNGDECAADGRSGSQGNEGEAGGLCPGR